MTQDITNFRRIGDAQPTPSILWQQWTLRKRWILQATRKLTAPLSARLKRSGTNKLGNEFLCNSHINARAGKTEILAIGLATEARCRLLYYHSYNFLFKKRS